MLIFLVLSSCRKENMEDLLNTKPNSDMFGQQCLNNTKTSPLSQMTQYKSRVFYDGFDGAIAGDPCYSMEPICSYRLDWGSHDKCKFNYKDPKYDGLKNLNKCVWKVFTGWDFWANRYSVYKADHINVKDGKLILKVAKNIDYNPQAGDCGAKGSDEWSADYFNRNCKIGVAGIASKYADSTYHGYSTQFGRIEMKIRVIKGNTTQRAYPALWMWPETLGKGYPHKATTNLPTVPHPNGNTEPLPIMEIDILEHNGVNTDDYMWQTVHNWEGSGNTGNVGEGRIVDLKNFNTYGVEWSPGLLRFYVNECITHEVKTGDKPGNAGGTKAMTISDVASYMMITFGLPGDHNSGEVDDRYEIDEVSIFH